MTAVEMELCPAEDVLEMTIADGGAAFYTAGDGISIQNRRISADETIARLTDLPDISGKAENADLAAHIANGDRHVTAAEKMRWDNAGFSGDYNDLQNKPEIPQMADIQAYIDGQLGVIENGAY